MSKEDAIKLCRAFFDKVDGGYCTSCTTDAIDAYKEVFPKDAEIISEAWEIVKVEE